jgi:hypothetical protein
MSNIDTDYDMDEVLGTYRLDGSMLRTKARILLEDWIERIYPRLQDTTTPTSTLLDIGKTLIELGDMKPKTNAQPVATGPGFSITINIPQSNGAEPIVIEGTPVAAEPEPDDFLDQINTDVAKGIAIPDFNADED